MLDRLARNLAAALTAAGHVDDSDTKQIAAELARDLLSADAYTPVKVRNAVALLEMLGVADVVPTLPAA